MDNKGDERMKFETGFGTLDLPHSECVRCIAADRYMLCTMCEFKETMVQFALSVVNRKAGEMRE